MLSGPSFMSAFAFNINSLILSGFPLACFYLAEAYLLFLSFALLFVQLPKLSHFQYSFCNQPVLFAQLENVNKFWDNNCTVCVNKRNQNKCKTKSRNIQIDHGFFCSIYLSNSAMVVLLIKGWLNCLTSESKGRFLVNNILNTWLSMIPGYDTNPIFLGKKKLDVHNFRWPPTPCFRQHLNFALTPHPLSKWTLYVYHPKYYLPNALDAF